MNPDERKVFEALDDPQWDARTVRGLVRDTGLPVADVIKVLNDHADLLDVSTSKEHGFIFRLKDRSDWPHTDFVEKALEYLSLGNRRRKIA
jgi:hypothetical protein